MALFGGQRRGFDMSAVGNLLLGSNEVARRRALEDEQRQRAMQAQQQQQAVALSDRLRAQLSPADGPNGSGTGAAPSVEQQMAALNEARLLNPAVADQFAPFVQGNQRQQDAQRLFANDPKAQALYSMGNQSFLDSLGEQYKPQVVAEGGIQSVYGEGATVRNPRTREFGNSLVRDTPTGIETLATRGPSYSEQASLQNAGTAAANAGFTLGQGQQRFGPNGQPLAENTAPRPPSAQQVELQGQFDTNTNEVIPTLNQMRSMVESGDVITGLGADVRLQAARALAAAGNQDAQRQVAATEAYRNMSGRLRVGMAKTLGANPSNADIKLLEQVTAGDIGQNAQSLLATIDQGLSFANQRNSALSAQLGQGQGQGQSQGGQQGPIAVNPQTGQRVQWNGQQWVPIR